VFDEFLTVFLFLCIATMRIWPVVAHRLRKIYFSLLIPAILGFIGFFFLKQLGILEISGIGQNRLFNVSIFVLAICTAVAAPIFFRSYFAHQQRNEKRIAEAVFIRFEQSLIRIALIAPYFCLVSYIFDFPEFYLAASFIASLYAIYYYYPSQKRLTFEKRIFRVE